MTYIVFALIVAAAVLYLLFSDSRATRAPAASTMNREKEQLLERLSSIKLMLKDMDYEQSVGKMDVENFSRLQNELLTEWDQIEKKMAALPESNMSDQNSEKVACPQCGASILTAAAKFCHACGAKLALWLLALICFFTVKTEIAAFEIRVSVNNGTLGHIESAPLNVQLLKLEQGMQAVTAKATTAGKVTFTDLPEMKAGPYMVQVLYRGVTYSRVIPPNVPSPAEIALEIFDSTTSVGKLRVRTLIELRRIEKNVLAGLMIFFFVNGDRKTFTGGKDGLEFFLPAGAKIEQASVSVGTGASNIQWLKLNPGPTARQNIYAAGQNVKPGERIMQVVFRMPYDEKETKLAFQSLYPQDTGIQLIAEPESMEVKQGEKILTRVKDESLGRGLISFTARENQIVFSLSGGGVAETLKSEEAEIEIKSPLALWQKFLFPLLALVIFVAAGWFKSRRNAAA